MKKLLIILILFSTFIFFNGCYTIVNHSGSYTYIDNSESIIINNPVSPPPLPYVPPVIVYPDPPQQPVTKERINEEQRPSNSSGDRLRDSGGRGNDKGNNNRSSR